MLNRFEMIMHLFFGVDIVSMVVVVDLCFCCFLLVYEAFNVALIVLIYCLELIMISFFDVDIVAIVVVVVSLQN